MSENNGHIVGKFQIDPNNLIITGLTEKNIIREYIEFVDITQKELAERAGFKRQSNISSLLQERESGVGMRIDNFYKVITALGGELIVRDKRTGKEWTVNL